MRLDSEAPLEQGHLPKAGEYYTGHRMAAVRPRLAYLTTEYPKVSHTFIRREVLEIEKLGYTVLRLSVRPSGDVLVDPADRSEEERTVACLASSPPKLALIGALTLAARPLRALRAVRTTLRLSRRSERGLVRHLAYLAEAAFFLRVLERERIDHLHVHFGTNAAAVAMLIRLLGGPSFSLAIHGPDEFDAPIGLSLREKVEAAEFVTTISRYASAQIRRWLDYEQWGKIHIVRCTAGVSFLEGSYEIPEDSRLLVCVGRLSAQKGQLLLLDAFSELLGRGYDAHLVLVGDGEMRAACETRIESLSLGDRVEITGWVDEEQVRKLLLEARGLVVPSFAEGLPVVIMEALGLGRPVVATAVAGIPELAVSGESAWIVPAGETDALVRALMELLDAPIEELRRMGRKGAARVHEEHVPAKEALKLAQLFERHARA